ncbi:MAG: DUF2203 domain-containing protein [Gemmataceae bacterium]|nr:DUF2203 domain-containing protein [Gemmataceae bacterium]
MVANGPEPGKKYYSVAEANATLPLVRAIVRDIAELARDLHERQERLERVRPNDRKLRNEAYQEEVDRVLAEIERDRGRMREFAGELAQLGIEMKDPYVGLIDFPCWMGNREVYLCWRLGEADVGFWHELEAGFAGRQKINSESRIQSPDAGRVQSPER